MDENIKMALNLYIEVLKSLKSHCMGRKCKDCAFSRSLGSCLIERRPYQYSIGEIENAVYETIIQELEEKD